MFQKCARGQGGEEDQSPCLGLGPPGTWDLVRVHILTHSQCQPIAFGIMGEQQGSLARYQVLPSFLLSSCHTNGILYIVLCVLMGVDKFGDCQRRVPPRGLWFIFSQFLHCGCSWCEERPQLVGKGSTWHHCVFEHISYVINWSGQAHWDFGKRSGPINENSIPEKARMSSSHIAANKPCHSFWVF